MADQGSSLGFPPSGGGGGEGGDYPFSYAYAKTRHFIATGTKTIPQGAMYITILNRGIANAVITISPGCPEFLGPGMAYTFTAQQNTVDLKMELSKQIDISSVPGDSTAITVCYPSSSGVDPFSI